MNCVIAIGSNYGDREGNIIKAFKFLSATGEIVSRSGIYESPDFLGIGRGYLNAVVMLETSKSEEALNLSIKEFEKECGRDCGARERGEVCIDVDIVIYNNVIRRPKDYSASYFKKGYSEISKNIFEKLPG